MSRKIAILGAGSWATALAVLLANKGLQVEVWSRRAQLAEEINEKRENLRYLPGVILSDKLKFTASMEKVLLGAGYIIFCVPSFAFRGVLQEVLPYLTDGAVIINGAKGIELDTLQRLSEVFFQEAGPRKYEYVVLSGPSHAEEVSREIPTAVVCAGSSEESAAAAQDLFMTKHFRVYTSSDVKGVELGGALKNIIALGTGISEGLGFGDNTTAALMTRGLAEITRLGVTMGANPSTFAGLAGVGDLIVTCTSRHSRNRRAGIEIGKGKPLQEALAIVNMVVEGVRTTSAARRLADLHGVEMPITEQIYLVLYDNLSPREAVFNLMSRDRRNELESNLG
ncbi:MAG TPA: NAD(P)H-dependent glycerol-3-phosphate dehydrogenase [Desulfotomaculum sp.]|nr:MAG: Glycerol-3-phosphate dehydrogenase [NAD(P)+] [Desulfotomaculum sp. 46_80]KUK85419.1 MAG: Glycerol-3-phosphate dehydrogenase [NAD(P)+] [Desulfofundulus kuznetsovii]HAG09997.1 NAD(P)H-dependent glycerol-3-phosphate dehydrogenase [Desulfotomaculum sp.]HBY03361.1 NAD(P)H-dependent glycerol-3-phosphate dehydrogenase [Desulfotomaculum sp.]